MEIEYRDFTLMDKKLQLILLLTFIVMCVLFCLIFKYVLHLDKLVSEDTSPQRRNSIKKIFKISNKIDILVMVTAFLLLLVTDIPDIILISVSIFFASSFIALNIVLGAAKTYADADKN